MMEGSESTDVPLNLSGWFLTDDPRDLRKWALPSGIQLDPDAYLVIFASGKD